MRRKSWRLGEETTMSNGHTARSATRSRSCCRNRGASPARQPPRKPENPASARPRGWGPEQRGDYFSEPVSSLAAGSAFPARRRGLAARRGRRPSGSNDVDRRKGCLRTLIPYSPTTATQDPARRDCPGEGLRARLDLAQASAARPCLAAAAGDRTPETISELAAANGVNASYFTRVLRIAYLAPDIIEEIIEGRQPPELTANKLIRVKNLPIDWASQREALGFSAA